MKTRKLYMLIIAALFLLIMPLQFGCDEAEDELQPEQTEEQAIGSQQGTADLPPIPETDPKGNPIDPATFTNSSNTKALSVEEIYLTDNSLIFNTLDSWDTEVSHTIKSNLTTGISFYSYHYYSRNGGSWIASGWQYEGDGGPSEYTWDVSFRKGDVIRTAGYAYKNGVYAFAWGPTYTIEDPQEPNPFAEFVLDEAINYIVDGLFNGFVIPFTQIAGWFSSGGLYDDFATVLVIDQDGNPLHGNIRKLGTLSTEPLFLGSVVKDDADNSLTTVEVRCLEPDGPESYDDNLYGKTVNVDLSPYGNEDYWGVDKHMPVITVTFNTNGTTTVDYPEPDVWEVMYDANALPTSSTPAWGCYLGGATESVSDGVLTLSGGSWPGYWAGPTYEEITVETLFKVNSGEMRLRIRNSSNRGVNVYSGVSSQWKTLRVTLTSSECKYYIDGVYQGTSAICTATNWHPVAFGNAGNCDVQFDYVAFKQGIFPPS